MPSAVCVVWRAGDGRTASLSRSGFGEIAVDRTGASVVTPGLACGATKGRGGLGVRGLAAEVDPVVSDSDSAAFDGAGSAAGPACSAFGVVGEGGDFKAEVSCESLLRSVCEEPGGLDFAILEDFLSYAVAGKSSSRRGV